MMDDEVVSAQTCLKLPNLDFTMTGPSKNRVRKWQFSCDLVVGTSSMLMMDDGTNKGSLRSFEVFDRICKKSKNAKVRE